ncbi:MAG TPA: protein kinase [Trebonia sp.]|nr:protein kinase [Trebonia sp.]
MSAWTVPGYVEERQLGRGASGRVVAAVHESSGHAVAIKYLASRLFRDPAFLDGFREEAELLRSLDVPDVVRIYDYVELTDQGAAIVMELVDGVSLHEMISRQGPAEPEAALAVLKGSLLGLAAAHQLGIVHRDYKPENVLVDAEGNSKLSDFGVAVRAGRDVPAAGTPLYMAPEQWSGAPATPATDIYAASAVFFECLTGRAPFSGRLEQLAEQHEAAPVPLQQIEEPMGDLIGWGMSKDPRRRPANAMEFVAELDHLARDSFGAYWEERGRSQLRERALALLALLGGIAIAEGEGSAQAASFFSRAGRRNTILGSAAVVIILALAATGTVYALTSNNTSSHDSSAAGTGSGGGTAAGTGSVSPAGAGSTTPAASATPSKKATAGATPSATPSATLPATTPTTATPTPTATAAATAAPKLSVSLSSSPGSPDAVTCGGKAPSFALTGTVASNQATTISYTWKRSNGTSASGTAHVGAGSSVALHDTLAAGSTSWKGSDALDITSPATASSSLPLSVTCTYPAMSISTDSLPAGTLGQSYTASLAVTGGDGGTLTWSETGLPAGLAISGNAITGTPDAQGRFSVTVTAKDAHGDTASKTYTLTVNLPIIG